VYCRYYIRIQTHWF